MYTLASPRLNPLTTFGNQKILDNYQLIQTQPQQQQRQRQQEYQNFKDTAYKSMNGSFKLVRDKNTGEIAALKIMNKRSILEYTDGLKIKRGISIQQSINHPHILKLYDYYEDDENIYLVLEYAENGSLFDYLKTQNKFSEAEAFVYFFQACLAVDFLHKKKILHRDLKPENLLLDREYNIKLADFGFSAENTKKRTTFCGTLDYIAPEMVQGQYHDHRLDIWCLGILLYEIIHGYTPFQGISDQEIFQNITNFKTIPLDPSISFELGDLIIKILRPSPIERLSMEEIFKHPWMKKHESYFGTNLSDYIAQVDEDESAFMGSITSNNALKSVENNVQVKYIYPLETTGPSSIDTDFNDVYFSNNQSFIYDLISPRNRINIVNQSNTYFITDASRDNYNRKSLRNDNDILNTPAIARKNTSLDDYSYNDGETCENIDISIKKSKKNNQSSNKENRFSENRRSKVTRNTKIITKSPDEKCANDDKNGFLGGIFSGFCCLARDSKKKA